MSFLQSFTPLADVVDIEYPSTSEAVSGSGAYVFFAIGAVLLVAAVALIVVNIIRRTKK